MIESKDVGLLVQREMLIAGQGLTGHRMRKLIAREGRLTIDRAIADEIERCLASFVGRELTPEVAVELREAIAEGLRLVALRGADS